MKDPKNTKKNYLAVGKPHRPKSDEWKEERKRGTKQERKSVKRAEQRNKLGTEKLDERMRGMQKKNGKERAAGEEQIELHLYYAIGGVRGQERTGETGTSAGRRRL